MNEHERRELDPPAMPLKRGDQGFGVIRVQEWLCLHGFHTAVDGDFGPATEAAVRAFQRHEAEEAVDGCLEWVGGAVDARTWRLLTLPLETATQHGTWKGMRDADRILSAASAHLIQHPREVGGPNAGPWVRYYCRGQEVPWCAGFVGTVLGQALGRDDWYTLSCDELARKAMERGRFKMGGGSLETVCPGDLFLIRAFTPDPQDDWKRRDDWIHTGIVTAVGDGYFEAVEGNTNTDGAREGTAVHARTRAFKPNVDFVLTGGER